MHMMMYMMIPCRSHLVTVRHKLLRLLTFLCRYTPSEKRDYTTYLESVFSTPLKPHRILLGCRPQARNMGLGSSNETPVKPNAAALYNCLAEEDSECRGPVKLHDRHVKSKESSLSLSLSLSLSFRTVCRIKRTRPHRSSKHPRWGECKVVPLQIVLLHVERCS